MSVVGFDIGNDNCVVAIVKPKAIQILQNDVSKYETPSVVSFTSNRRLIGSAGASSAGMYPRSTISQIKRLIGYKYDDPGMADEFKMLPFKTVRGPDGGILIEVDYLKKVELFAPVEILAMLLSHLKQLTERNGDDTSVVDCVIGVPSYFNDFQRVAYLNAAEIAGLKTLRLIHDGTATAIGYGYYNQEINSPTNIVFVDVGHYDTQVTVAEFNRKKVTILTHAHHRNVGGRDFDRVMYKYFAEKFKEEHKIDIDVDDKNSHHKARIRLMAACEKAKKVLTANREANISIDCFVEDKDLVGSINREEFEKLSKDLLEKIVKTCDDALMDLNGRLTVSDIHSVELVGSGSRIPAIGISVGKFFENKPPNRTLNGSECVARGCALQATILRSSNRGYNYEVETKEKSSFPVIFEIFINYYGVVLLSKRKPKNMFLTNKYRSFVKVSEKERLIKNLRNAENLIIAEGDQCINTYRKELGTLQQLVNQIESRFKHHQTCIQLIKDMENSIRNLKTSLTSRNLVCIYLSCTEELLSAIQLLFGILPKDIELLPGLPEKIKRITNLTNEINHFPKDVSKAREKYTHLFFEATRLSLSATCHDDKCLPPKESDKVEDHKGEAVARLIYTIFDSIEEIIHIKNLSDENQGSEDVTVKMVSNTCNEVGNFFKKMKSLDIHLDDLKNTQAYINGLRNKMQDYVVSMNDHAQASKNSINLNQKGSSTNELTETQEAEGGTTDIQNNPHEIEKQLFGRYRYFVKHWEKREITNLIEPSKHDLHVKSQMLKLLDAIKKRYVEYKNERMEAVGEFFEFFE